MGRYTGPKNRLSRREGRELFGKKAPRRLSQAPGQHGARSKNKTSTYGKQLREKQKVKRIYGLRERQFKKLVELATRKKGEVTGTILLQMLEQRLDNVVFRLGLARTRPQARQFVVQGFVIVDGESVTAPSYRVEPDQKVTLTAKAFANPLVQSVIKDATSLPDWLKVEKGQGIVLRKPTRDEIDQDLNENVIIGFYSR